MHESISSSPGRSFRFYLQSWKAPLLLGLVCFFVYNANLRQIGAGDSLPARYLPLMLWHNGTFDLDANPRLAAHGYSVIPERNRPAGAAGKVNYFEPSAYWMVRTRRHQLASLYPVVTPLLASPLYLPAVLWLDAHGWEQPQVDRVAELMEKISASLLASLASVLMFLALRREDNPWSLPLALAFAFGTNTWMISSQALWQHGSGEFLVALALLLVVSSATPIRLALLGAVCVLMAANRPPDGLIAGAFVLFTFWKYKRNALWLFAGAALPLAALLYYNLYFMGNIAGGYGLVKPSDTFFQPIWSGLAGLLVSPTRGLLVFSPFLLFIPLGLRQRLRTPGSRSLAVALGLAVITQILFYSLGDWRAGVSWGPRWLTDVLPIMVWMLAPAPLVLRSRTRGLLVLLMAASVGVQTIGAFWYTGASNERIFANGLASMRAAWNPRNLPFLVEFRHPHARPDLLCEANGAIDKVGTTLLDDNADVPVLEPGAAIEGWANACGRTPTQLFVLIDGILIGSTSNFTPRADINAAMQTASPTSWRVTANTLGVPSGERVLQIALRVQPSSINIRIVREQRVIVVAEKPPVETATMPQHSITDTELDAMAKRAAALLRERQSVDGYWLTAHTTGLRYETPQQEMNTFLTSMLVDFLAPVAHQRNLDDVVERARRHLAAQIESNGLVRYHGLPNAPIIGKLGCVITPDTDDTALVWRVTGSGAGDLRMQQMLQELARYRDARGLYRSWLAPQNQYQCLDPGNDPNPTDIAIQMHVYLMLRELDPPAAQNLCTALQRSLWDGDLWVYYSKAPLIPYLRSAELRQLGCAIPQPTERLMLPAKEQEIWSEAARLLVQTNSSPPDANARQAIRNLLARLGKDDFALLRNSPPMLYHNDLSATVKRFYWSEDFGYALWLRLYEAADVKTGGHN